MKTKPKTPTDVEVAEALVLGEDLRLATLLVEWNQARKRRLRNKDGKSENRILEETINALGDYLEKEPERKGRLMNEMIRKFG